jgi:H+/Cl- antiporter ClcA
LFAKAVLLTMEGKPAWLGTLRQRHPVLLAAGCGVALVLLAAAFGNGAFGTGYEQARGLVQGNPTVGHEFGVMKILANLVSYIAGIPGGLFSPALAVGAGIGHNMATLMPGVDGRVFVLLGMCAYLTGVTQAPLTSAVISLELTDSSDMLLPILATVLLARGVSGLVCRVPIYRGMANQLLKQIEPAKPQTKDPA